jgi:hypothetical protein
MAVLHFLSGPLAGKRVVLKARQISIGRDARCSVRIDDESVAPRHLVLIRDDDGYAVYIDASKPPVAVNGKQVVNATLKTGDLLQLGAVRARFKSTPLPATKPRPFDFADAPLKPRTQAPTEILSLDDAEPLPLEDDARPSRKAMRVTIALGVLMLMLGGSVIAFRQEFWKKPETRSTIATTATEKEPPPKIIEKPEESKRIEPAPELPALPLAPIAIGAGPSGLTEKGKVLRTRQFKTHQEAVDSARPGDSVIFDSIDTRPIVVTRPLRDVQFLSGEASWEIHADIVDCQWVFHAAKQFLQRAGKAEQCVFFRCPMKQTRFVHADAVSLYFDERTPLHPRDNPAGREPILQFNGFVRNVLIHNPWAVSNATERKFDTRWGPSIRVHATDSEGDGRGTYLLHPVIQGQRAWTPHELTRGNGVTYAHATCDGSAWADPVFTVARGDDCVLLANSFAGEVPTTVDQFLQVPRRLRYHDHEEFGHDKGPAFRGAAITVTGMRTRVVAHGDARKPWTVNRRMALPGLHYADGVVVRDPFVSQFATDQGGLSLNLAEMKGVFVQQSNSDGDRVFSAPEQPDGSPLYPRRGPALYPPVFIPLKDLRVSPGEFDRLNFIDMTGKPIAEIETALGMNKAIFLGKGTYEFTQSVRSGAILGAGMNRTILKWPETIDCVLRPSRGILNATVSGGRFGFLGQPGPAAKVAGGGLMGAEPLFLRTRFQNLKQAGLSLASANFLTIQDCEFINCRDGVVCREEGQEIKKDTDIPLGRPIDNLDLCNCTFQKIGRRAIDLAPRDPHLGHVGIFNCLFDGVGDSAIRVDGGQTHLAQQCELLGCGGQSYAPPIDIRSRGSVVLSHTHVDSTGVKGNPVCVALTGQAAVSQCFFKGMPTSLKCDGILAADRVTADGNLEARPGSILCQCQFRNMNLPGGTAIARQNGFADVSASVLPVGHDATPPSVVRGARFRSSNGGRQIDWEPADDPESGIAGYVVFSGGREIGRVDHLYDAPSDLHSPIFKLAHATTYFDANNANRDYEVIAINGAGMSSDGRVIPIRRLGPARAVFLDRDGGTIGIKDFIAPKGKTGLLILDDQGNRLMPTQVGLKGRPNRVFFEAGEALAPP